MFNFFVLKVKGGRELYIADAIQNFLAKKGLDDLVEEIISPEMNVSNIHAGKKKTVKKSVLIGYIILKAKMNRELCGLINTVEGVYGFLGGKDFPIPVKKNEIDSLMQTIDNINEDEDDCEDDDLINVGDVVKINEGMFESFTGTVNSINKEKKRLKVAVSIFNGSNNMTTVDLDFNQVIKSI